jgi:hypothetical protein
MNPKACFLLLAKLSSVTTSQEARKLQSNPVFVQFFGKIKSEFENAPNQTKIAVLNSLLRLRLYD